MVIFASSSRRRIAQNAVNFSVFKGVGSQILGSDDSPETVVGRWILPAKLKALLGSSTLLSQVIPHKDLMAESKSPLLGIATLVLWTEVTDEELALAEDLPEGRQLDAVFAGPGEPRIREDELELDDLEGVREFDLGVAPK